MNAKYRAADIAAWLIERDNKEEFKKNNKPIDISKLMKLLYYAQGAFLAIDEEPLFNEDIIAWEYGPVVKDVYTMFDGIDPREIYKCDYKNILNSKELDDDTIELLEQTYIIFGKNYTAKELVDKTHREAPWLKATNYGEYLNGKIIGQEDIKSYFQKYYIVAV